MRILLIYYLIALGGVYGQDREESAVVVAPIGQIRGRFNESMMGRRFFSARGIRYGEAPVGDLRFRNIRIYSHLSAILTTPILPPAVPAENLTTVFDPTEEGPACPQPYATFTSEDCLRLNVYSPELPSSDNPDVKIPVLVFFHPGGFYSSSGQSLNFGPEYLMDQEIVLVTVNYRLMSLGFISTGDSEAPGNLGLKDQVLALRWIQSNIVAFGGDLGSVTISGYSAGGWSVSLHIVSPMSKGLFHRAIAMSGALTDQERLGGNQSDLAIKQAGLLNCTTNTTQEMMACLRTVPVDSFSDSLSQMYDWDAYPILLWSAVVEPDVPGVERFLTAEPVDLIRQGKFHQVPLITGITRDEFGGNVVFWVAAVQKGSTALFDDLNNKWDHLAPILFQYERGTPRSKNISAKLRLFYFNDEPASVDTIDGLAQLFADSITGFPVHRLANLIAGVSREPVYYYEFSYQGRYSHRMWSDTNKTYGVVHHDDLLYLFRMNSEFPHFEIDDEEYLTVKRMTSMWSSFAKTGNPIPDDDDSFANVTWEGFTPTNNKYLYIGDTLTMNTSLYADRMDAWEKACPLGTVVENGNTTDD